jgi:hypothetical protein
VIENVDLFVVNAGNVFLPMAKATLPTFKPGGFLVVFGFMPGKMGSWAANEWGTHSKTRCAQDLEQQNRLVQYVRSNVSLRYTLTLRPPGVHKKA